MKQKNIGILIPINDGAAINARYLNYFSKFGNLQFINPMDEEVHNLDLLVLPGGADVDTANYQEKPGYFTQRPNQYNEWFFNNMLDKYIKSNTPIFGVCAGFQFLAVAFGSKLTQHMYIPVSDPRNKCVETLDFTGYQQPNKKLQEFADYYKATNKKNSYMINSIHHQGCYPNQVGQDVRVLAISQEYGNVEAMTIEGYPIASVQFHAEEIDCSYAELLIDYLLTYNKIKTNQLV